MRPPTRKSAEPMCEPSSAPTMLSAIRRKSDGVMVAPGLTGCAGLERRPVDSLLVLLVDGKDCLKCEGKLRGSMGVEVPDASLGFVDARNMPGRHPPKR